MPSNWQQLRDEALEIIVAAGEADVDLRVVGGVGVRLHCAEPAETLARIGRVAKDIDFVVPKEGRKALRRLLEDRGYLVDRDLLVAMEGRRYSFSHPTSEIELDVFVERLEFNHTIEVRSRLDRHPVTISLEDLLMQKLQIVQLTANDLVDISVLLATHPVATEATSTEEFSSDYIAGLLGKDWGFHHTATRNLERIAAGTDTGVDLGSALSQIVRDRSNQLLHAVGQAPKTMGWRIRAKVGERVQWWEDVDEREGTY